MAEALRTRRTPGRPAVAVSNGNVTVCSTSSAASPGLSAITTTVGAFSSGKTSTGIVPTRQVAASSSSAAPTSTTNGRCSANAISWRNMAAYSWSSCQVPSAWKWPPLFACAELASTSS